MTDQKRKTIILKKTKMSKINVYLHLMIFTMNFNIKKFNFIKYTMWLEEINVTNIYQQKNVLKKKIFIY